MKTKEDIFSLYLESNMTEYELITSLDLIQDKDVKKDGVIYTPWEIVQKMISFSDIKLSDKIIEPSCGHGIFLIGLLKYMHEQFSLKDKDLFDWFINQVTGIEISKNTVGELKKILKLFFKKSFNLDIKTTEFVNIICNDSLKIELSNYDLCIGNPPYIRAKHLSEEYLGFLKNNFSSCKKGTVDIYFAFIERYSELCNRLVFITPNSFLNTSAGKLLKSHIKDKTNIIIDFKEKRVFQDASVYTCILKTDKNINSSKFLYSNDLNSLKTINKNDFFDDIKKNIGLFPIVFTSIATLADSVFLVKRKNNKYYATFDEKEYEIEKNFVVPYLKLTKIKTNDLSQVDYMIFPYEKNSSKIYDEEYIKSKFPMGYKYLCEAKDKLNQRDKGKTSKYEKWYAYGRKQGLNKIHSNNVISIPLMVNSKCKPIQLDISEIQKDFGMFVFTSGYIIEITKDNKSIIPKLLSEKFVDFARENGKPWPGKEEPYYALTSKHVKSFK